MAEESVASRAYAEVGATHRILHDDFASEWMGVRVLRIAPGFAEIEMNLRREMLNGFGIAHGGMVFAFADTAFALACNEDADTGTITVASGVDINFLRPAHVDQTLRARASAVHEGRSGVYDIEVFAYSDDSPEPERIALVRGRSRTIPKPA